MPRVYSATNFKGEKYATEKFVEDKLNLPENLESLVDPETGKIDASILPKTGVDLKFNGKDIATSVTEMNFTGTTTLTTNEDGSVKIQIGENQNSSSWNAKDGKVGDGTVVGAPTTSTVIIPDATGSTFKTGDWTAGTSLNVGTKVSSITYSSNSYIHMDEGENLWTIKVYGDSNNVLLQANVIDTVVYTKTGDDVTGATVTSSAVSYVTGTAGLTHALSNQGLEDNYPSAVGGRAKVSFTFDLTKITDVQNGGRFSVEIVGCGGNYKSVEMFRITGVTPTIASVSIAPNTDSYAEKTISGVKYVKSATFTASTGDIANLNNQAGVTNKLTSSSTPLNAPTGIQSSALTGYTNAYDNVSTYTKADITLKTNQNIQGGNVGITFTASNAFGNSTGVTGNTSGININSYAETNSTDNVESFLVENKRLDNSLADWVSTNTLGDNDLQVIPGVGLKYPTIDYSAITYPAGNPDYSGKTGSRYFVRKFISGTRTKTGGSIEFTGVNSIFTNADFTAQLSIDGGNTWYNLKEQRGGNDPLGILTSRSGDVVNFSFPGTTVLADATTGVLVKIGWSDALSSATITKVTLTM